MDIFSEGGEIKDPNKELLGQLCLEPLTQI